MPICEPLGFLLFLYFQDVYKRQAILIIHQRSWINSFNPVNPILSNPGNINELSACKASMYKYR